MGHTNGLGLLSHLFRCRHDGLDDFLGSCAAANISLHKPDDIFLARSRRQRSSYVKLRDMCQNLTVHSAVFVHADRNI